MKRRIGIVLVALLLAAGSLFWWKVHDRGGESDLLTLYGNVDIRQVDAAFRVGGRIVEMVVEEGVRVEAGELLARLDPEPGNDALRRARAELAVQEAELTKMRRGYRSEDIEQARAELRAAEGALLNAASNLRRVEALRRRQAIAQKDLDEARAAHTEALARRNAAGEQARLMESGFRPEDVLRQEAAVAAATAAADSARLSLNDAWLYAPQSGVVLTRVRETGAVVQPGQTIYTITLDHPAWIRAYVTQPDLGNIRPGQQALLSIDATPGKSYLGTIGFISPKAEFTPKTVETREVRNDLVFRFRVIAEDPDNVMRQGMPVTVTLRKGGGKP